MRIPRVTPLRAKTSSGLDSRGPGLRPWLSERLPLPQSTGHAELTQQGGRAMRELNEKELSQVSGGKIEPVFIETTNPAGHPPPGQQDENPPNEQFTVVTENQNP